MNVNLPASTSNWVTQSVQRQSEVGMTARPSGSAEGPPLKSGRVSHCTSKFTTGSPPSNRGAPTSTKIAVGDAMYAFGASTNEPGASAPGRPGVWRGTRTWGGRVRRRCP